MSVQQYTLTLENCASVVIELEHCGGALWRHEILHGTPPFHYAFHQTFGECLRVACLRTEERYGSTVMRCESKASELEAIVQAIAKAWPPTTANGSCAFCQAELGAAHKIHCVWLRARKAVGLDVP